jgi:predicted nucleic acid-binding protein
MKTNKVFLDTNIWLYSMISTNPEKHRAAKSILQNPSNEIYCNSQIVNEVCYNLILKKILNEDDIKKLINNFYDKYIVTTISKAILLDSVDIRKGYNVDVWSSIIMAGAKLSECDVLYSDTILLTKVFEVDVINPFDSTDVPSAH